MRSSVLPERWWVELKLCRVAFYTLASRAIAGIFDSVRNLRSNYREIQVSSKNRIRQIILALLFLTAVTVMSSAMELTPGEADRLDALSQRLEDATLAGDYDTLLDAYAEDVIIAPDFQPAIRGRTALKKRYQENRKDGLKYHSFSGTPEKRWRVGDEIFDYGSFGMAVSQGESQSPKAYHGSYFQIWQIRPDGGFAIRYIIWNLDYNPCKQ